MERLIKGVSLEVAVRVHAVVALLGVALPGVALPVVTTVAMVVLVVGGREALVVGPHDGRPSVVLGFVMMVPAVTRGLTVVGGTRLGGLFMVVGLTWVMEPARVGNLPVLKLAMVVGLPGAVGPPRGVGLFGVLGSPGMAPATMTMLLVKAVLLIVLVGEEGAMGWGGVGSALTVGLATATAGSVRGVVGGGVVMEVLERLRMVRSANAVGLATVMGMGLAMVVDSSLSCPVVWGRCARARERIPVLRVCLLLSLCSHRGLIRDYAGKPGMREAQDGGPKDPFPGLPFSPKLWHWGFAEHLASLGILPSVMSQGSPFPGLVPKYFLLGSKSESRILYPFFFWSF